MKAFFKSFLSKFFYFLPKKMQNHLRCFFNNLFNRDFKVFFKKNYLHFIFSKNHEFKCYANINTGIIIDEVKNVIKGYLQKYFLKKGDFLLDIGGHIGIFSLYASKLIGDSGKIFVFEPDKKNYLNAKQNIQLNNLSNIVIFNKGIWDKDTSLFFSNSGTAKSSLIKSKLSKKVSVVKLDNEIKRLSAKKINFVKMDIEGAEINAIKGFNDFLKKNKTNLAIASYHIVNGEKTFIKLEKMLKKLGYNVETSFPQHLTTFATKS